MSEGSVNPITPIFNKIKDFKYSSGKELPSKDVKKAEKLIKKGKVQTGKLYSLSKNYRRGFKGGLAWQIGQNKINANVSQQQQQPAKPPANGGPPPPPPPGNNPQAPKPPAPNKEKEMEKQKPNELKKWRKKKNLPTSTTIQKDGTKRVQPRRFPRSKRKGR